MSFFSWVRNHFQKYRERSKTAFLWRISLEGLLVPLLLAALVASFVDVPVREDLGAITWRLVVAIVVFAPFFETLLFQALPVMVARRCGLPFWAQVATSVVPFAAAHFTINWSTGLFAGIVSGFYLAFTYARWREVSFRTAFWMTAAMHAIHNGIAAIGLLFEP